MELSEALNTKLNEQITHELASSQIYLSMACLCDGLGLKNMAGLFRRQTDEERTHAMKILDYMLEAGGTVQLQAIAAPPAEWASVEAAIEAALQHEKKVTGLIHGLVALADKEKDYATRSFLNWFVDEQVEEEDSFTTLLQAAKLAGKNLLQLEAYVAHVAAK